MNAQSQSTVSSATPVPAATAAAAQRTIEIGDQIVRETMTPLLLLDLVTRGDLGLVERVLASITGMDRRTVNALLFDRGWIGVRTLYRAAGFELRHLRAVCVALETLRDAGGGVETQDRTRHVERCLARFLTDSDHLCEDDVGDVLALFEETPRVFGIGKRRG